MKMFDSDCDSNFKSTADYYVIDLGLNRIPSFSGDLWHSWDDYSEFIDNSYNQIIDAILSRMSDDEKPLFKTPRRKSKRRPSLAVRNYSTVKANKYRKLSTARKSRRHVETSFDENQELAQTNTNATRVSSVLVSQCNTTAKKSKRKTKTRNTVVESECYETQILVEQKQVKPEVVSEAEVRVEREWSEEKLAVSLEKLKMSPHGKSIKTPEGVWRVKHNECQTYVIEDNNLQTTETVGEVNEDIKCNDKSNLELFSELSLMEVETNEAKGSAEQVVTNQCDEHNAQNKDNEWETDDENSDGNEFYDAVDDMQKKNKRKLHLMNSNRKELTNSSTKAKRKKSSLYFTPSQTTGMTTRANTRTVSRIAVKLNNLCVTPSQTKPQSNANTSSVPRTIITRQMKQNITSSGQSADSARKYGSTARSTRCVSRIKTPDTKQYTESAKKRRAEAEEERIKRLEATKEKEEKALKNRQILLEKLTNERKMKAQEKFHKAAEMRELQKQKDEERLRKEQEKREDYEKRLKILEAEKARERREILQKKHEEKLKKINDCERKKQLMDQQEMAMKMQRQEDMRKRMEMEREAAKETERMAAIIQQHNSSLQQKAMAQSFLKKTETSKSNLSNVSVDNNQSRVPLLQPEVANTTNTSHLNNTYVVNKEEKETSVYEMTPPPKEYNVDNYDISEIKSDDDTDDERQPKKPIPSWARGSNFLAAIKQQYGKSWRSKLKECQKIYGSVKLPVDLGLIFVGQRAVAAKYAKRTSSAVWTSPPKYYSDSSRSDISFK